MAGGRADEPAPRSPGPLDGAPPGPEDLPREPPGGWSLSWTPADLPPPAGGGPPSGPSGGGPAPADADARWSALIPVLAVVALLLAASTVVLYLRGDAHGRPDAPPTTPPATGASDGPGPRLQTRASSQKWSTTRARYSRPASPPLPPVTSEPQLLVATIRAW